MQLGTSAHMESKTPCRRGHIGWRYRVNYACVQCLQERSASFEAAHRQRRNDHTLRRAYVKQEERKNAIVNMYTNGKGGCVMCGQCDIDVLCVDHIDGAGTKHRKEIHAHNSQMFYNWIVANDYPPMFQILCANCNLKKEVVRRRDGRRLTSH